MLLRAIHCPYTLSPKPPLSELYSEAAASMAPAALNMPGLVTTTSTGYFHSMNLAQPTLASTEAPLRSDSMLLSSDTRIPLQLSMHDHSPQYAHFLPKYFPRYGTATIVRMSSICCNDSRHSRSASETNSLLSAVELVEDEGKEFISLPSEKLSGSSMKEALFDMDMASSDGYDMQ